MDSNRALPPEIEQALARGWTILTANQRAARTLRRDFDLRQQPPRRRASGSLRRFWPGTPGSMACGAACCSAATPQICC